MTPMHLLIWLTLACPGDDTTPTTDCETVALSDCADHPDCTPAVASALGFDPASGKTCWAEGRENVVCVPRGTFGTCGDAETPGAPPDDPDSCYLFPNTCLPPGWTGCVDPPETHCATCTSDEIPGTRSADVMLSGGIGLGRSVAVAGDMNGDGHTDLIAGRKRGAVVLFGPFEAGSREVSDDDSTWNHAVEEERVGWAVVGLGDFDGDGSDDVGVGAPRMILEDESNGPGAVFVLTGPVGAGTHTIEEAPRRLDGETYGDEAGAALAGGGDLDGDGTADLLVAAPYTDDNGSQSGSVYVITGPLSGSRDDLGIARTQVLGEETAGRVLAVHDVDGDGSDDLLLGESPASATVLYGPLAAGSLLSSAGERLAPTTHGSTSPTAVTAGDLDGDGAAELAWSSATDDSQLSDAGAVWIVRDPWHGGGGVVDPDSRVLGRCEGDQAGLTLAIADVTGDGHQDLLVGASGRVSAELGGAVFEGPVGGGDLLLSDATWWLGTEPAEALDVGDLDGDGVDDVVAGDSESGTIRLWFGGW